MNKVMCPICETFDNSILIYKANFDEKSFSTEIFSARRLPDRRYFQWVRCNSCGLLRSDPVIPLDLEVLYKESEFNYTNEIQGLKKTYINILKKALGKSWLKNSIFEIGGGNGFFLEAVKDAGFKVIAGVEPSKDAVNKARPDILPFMITGMMNRNSLMQESFDVGVIFHVMDHLTSPLNVLTDCFNALNQGGTLIIAVHNERSWSARLFGSKSPIIDVEHTFLFNKKTAKKLLEKAGYVDVKFGSYSNNYSLRYLVQLFPFFRKYREYILTSKFGNLLGNFKVIIPLGNMWVSGSKP
jgi:SAM-dependent methyltransferase